MSIPQFQFQHMLFLNDKFARYVLYNADTMVGTRSKEEKNECGLLN